MLASQRVMCEVSVFLTHRSLSWMLASDIFTVKQYPKYNQLLACIEGLFFKDLRPQNENEKKQVKEALRIAYGFLLNQKTQESLVFDNNLLFSCGMLLFNHSNMFCADILSTHKEWKLVGAELYRLSKKLSKKNAFASNAGYEVYNHVQSFIKELSCNIEVSK